MPKSGLSGPYLLNFNAVTTTVSENSPGVFALGHLDPAGKFRIAYVSRAEKNLQSRLCEHIGSDLMFKFAYCATARQAFEKECTLFHDFKPPANCLHPARSSGSDWLCPRCA